MLGECKHKKITEQNSCTQTSRDVAFTYFCPSCLCQPSNQSEATTGGGGGGGINKSYCVPMSKDRNSRGRGRRKEIGPTVGR